MRYYSSHALNVSAHNPEPQMITTAQIEALKTEAGEHGDTKQVAICDQALAGDEKAVVECARVITDAQAVAEE